MSQIAPVASVSQAPAVPVPAAQDPASHRDYRSSVSQAVSRVNEAGFAGAGREAVFSVDRATRIPVVKVVDSDTKEVITQWPAEYVLQLAQTIKDTQTGDSG